MDQIIDIYSGTINVSAPSSSDGFKQVTVPIPHDFGDSVYFQGRFSTDGGSTWNDFGSMTPVLTGSLPTFSTADCNAYSDESNVYVKAVSWYDRSNGVGRAYTFQYELFAIAKNHMAHPINPRPTMQKLSLFAKYNYEKIYAMDSVNINVPSESIGSVPVSHTLGKIPTVRAWFFHANTPNVCRPIIPDNTEQLYTPIEIRLSTNEVVFRVDASWWLSTGTNGRIEYRIYYD